MDRWRGLSLWPDIALQIGIALVMLAVFVTTFHFGAMGGGDVKMIGALLALWFPFQPLVTMLVIMSLAGGAITLLMLVDKWVRRQRAQPQIPYDIAIAIAALLTLREPILNQFT